MSLCSQAVRECTEQRKGGLNRCASMVGVIQIIEMAMVVWNLKILQLISYILKVFFWGGG